MQEVELQSVSRTYDGFFAVHRVSMQFAAGDVTALVGDNGSGKTTLLSLLATLEQPSAGSVTYDDVDWETFADDFRDRVGWIAHDPLTYADLTGRENLRFYADLYGLEGAAARVDEWLARVGLDESADRETADYSRGMRQRLSIARSMLQDPDLLLFDEPISGLDRAGRRTVLELLDELGAAGKVVIFASHDLDAVETAADRCAILDRGRLATDVDLDTTADLPALYRTHA